MSLKAIREAVSLELGLNNEEAAQVVAVVAKAISENVGAASVRVPPLDDFKLRYHGARMQKDKLTGEQVRVRAHSELTFKESR